MKKSKRQKKKVRKKNRINAKREMSWYETQKKQASQGS